MKAVGIYTHNPQPGSDSQTSYLLQTTQTGIESANNGAIYMWIAPEVTGEALGSSTVSGIASLLPRRLVV